MRSDKTVIARLRKKSWQSKLNRLLRLSPRNDGLSEYCKNVFTNELQILNGVVFLFLFLTKKEMVFDDCPPSLCVPLGLAWFFFSTKKEQGLLLSFIKENIFAKQIKRFKKLNMSYNLLDEEN